MAARDDRFDKVVYLIEADDFAIGQLWSTFATSSRIEGKVSRKIQVRWDEDSRGLMHQVGSVKIGKEKFPVMCQVTFAKIEGFTVAFYTSTSRIVDWDLVHDWIQSQSPNAGKCDASNFHLCLDKIRDLKVLSDVQES